MSFMKKFIISVITIYLPIRMFDDGGGAGRTIKFDGPGGALCDSK